MDAKQRISSRTGTNLTDRDLVVAFKGGDARAYAAIYREYRPVAESICHRILGNADDAQEAAQETMLRVFQGLGRFNGRYLLRAWVARIATNVCLDMLRTRQRRPDTSPGDRAITSEREIIHLAPEVEHRVEDPVELVVRIEESTEVRRTLGTMPDHHRAALEMREFDGMSHEQIGQALGMTAPQVKALLHRAKGSFKRTWTGTGTDGRTMSFALPAFAFPLRMLRRLASVGREAGTSAGNAAATVVQTPAVAPVTFAFAERFGAAAAAVVVAGGIGVGAAALPHHHRATPKPRPAVVAFADPAPFAPTQKVKPAAAVPAPAPAPSQSPTARSALPRGEGQKSETPSPSPSGTDSPAPVGSVTPPPPSDPGPAPGYGMVFRSNLTTDERCGCDSTGRLVGSETTSGTPGQAMKFGQDAEGAILDAAGHAALQVHVGYKGQLDGATGSLNVNFKVTNSKGTFIYQATLKLVKGEKAGDHWTYGFSGTYSFLGGPGGGDPMPRSGSLGATILIWPDGTPYDASFDLS